MTTNELAKLLVSPEIIAVYLTFSLEIIRRCLQPKAHIIYGIGHGFCFNVPQNTPNTSPLLISTQTIFIGNNGRAPVNNLEIYFNFKPEHFEIWPTLDFKPSTTPQNHFVIRLDSLGKKEHFSIELIQSQINPPTLLKVRTTDREWKETSLTFQKVYPKWFNTIALTLLLLGVYQLSVWLVKLLY